MATDKAGRRHALLIYQHLWSTLWKAPLFLGLMLGLLWWQANQFATPIIVQASSIWILISAGLAALVGLLALLLRKASYVRAYPDHIRLATPLLHLKISYGRLRGVRPAEFSQLFPPGQLSWSQRQFLSPFFGKTALLVNLSAFPLSPALMRLFLVRPLFAPDGKGLVFVVEDWMMLSSELDSFKDAWRGRQKKRSSRPGMYRGLQ